MMAAGLFLAQVLRSFIALLLLAAALGKVRSHASLRTNLRESFGLPAGAARLLAPLLIAVELLIAGWLLATDGPLPMLLSLLLLASVTCVLGYRFMTQSVVRCSCFGEASRPVSHHDLLRNVLVIVLNGFYFALAAQPAAPMAWATAWLALGLAAIMCVAAVNYHEIATLARAH